jgi:hypothetical protein
MGAAVGTRNGGHLPAQSRVRRHLNVTRRAFTLLACIAG